MPLNAPEIQAYSPSDTPYRIDGKEKRLEVVAIGAVPCPFDGQRPEGFDSVAGSA